MSDHNFYLSDQYACFVCYFQNKFTKNHGVFVYIYFTFILNVSDFYTQIALQRQIGFPFDLNIGRYRQPKESYAFLFPFSIILLLLKVSARSQLSSPFPQLHPYQYISRQEKENKHQINEKKEVTNLKKKLKHKIIYRYNYDSYLQKMV